MFFYSVRRGARPWLLRGIHAFKNPVISTAKLPQGGAVTRRYWAGEGGPVLILRGPIVPPGARKDGRTLIFS